MSARPHKQQNTESWLLETSILNFKPTANDTIYGDPLLPESSLPEPSLPEQSGYGGLGLVTVLKVTVLKVMVPKVTVPEVTWHRNIQKFMVFNLRIEA